MLLKMNKNELTRIFLTQAKIELTEKVFKNALWAWWFNPVSPCSLRLTENGHNFLVKQLQLQSFEFPCKDVELTSKNLLKIDRTFTSPFFLTHKSIILFGGTDASMLLLMEGDVFNYLKSLSRE
jgi:hypothetical protein